MYMMTDRTKYYKRDRGRDLRRSNPFKPRKIFEVDVIQDSHREIARRKMLGQKNTVIAKALGVSSAMVNYTVTSPKVKDHMDVLQGNRDAEFIDVKKEIQKLLPEAVKNLQSILNTGKIKGKEASATLIARESNNIIDREMGKPTQNIRSNNVTALFTADDIENIKKRAMAMEAPVIDV